MQLGGPIPLLSRRPCDARPTAATFLYRALDLPGASTDTFTDDGGSVHEPAIESIAAAGITRGCDPLDLSLFCPGEPVTRAPDGGHAVEGAGRRLRSAAWAPQNAADPRIAPGRNLIARCPSENGSQLCLSVRRSVFQEVHFGS